MPRTKPHYIYPSDTLRYTTLLEELEDLHKRIAQVSSDSIADSLEELSDKIATLKQITTERDDSFEEEITQAKGVYPTIDARFNALPAYNVLHELLKTTTTRTYTYNEEGMVETESVRGDMNYDITHSYDSFQNVLQSVTTDLQGGIISEKHYTYNDNDEITRIVGVNTDDVMLVSNALVDKEQNTRLDLIEAIDFVKLGLAVDSESILAMQEKIHEMTVSVNHLLNHLPENITYLINTSEIFRRLDAIEEAVDANRIYYTFDVISTQTTYSIPESIQPEKVSVYLEGLLLEKDADYTIETGTIVFHILLIDYFTVSLRQ